MKDAPTAKMHKRLSREVRAKLNKTIEDYFDAVVERDLPERFRLLLAQFDRLPEKAAQDDARSG